MSKHKLYARIWIFLVFALVTAAHYCFYRFSMDPRNPFAFTRGATFGCALWAYVLLVAVWLRHGWARYLLIVLTCLGVAGFGFAALALEAGTLGPGSLRMGVFGLALYAAAAVFLWISRSLQRYLAPRTAGE